MTALERLADWFKSQVGVRETEANNVIYNTHYYGTAVNGAQYPWCCAFIWDGFRSTDLSGLFCGGQKTAYCPFVVGYAKQHNQWVTDNFRRGDLLLYDWNGDGTADHIGFCLSWNGQYAIAVEGNSNDAVEQVTRYPGNILGAYRPNYPAEESGSSKTVYTVRKGDSLWAIAEQFYGNGSLYNQIIDANGLTSSRIYPGQELVIPGAADSKEKKPVSPEIVSAVLMNTYGAGTERLQKLSAAGYDAEAVQRKVEELYAIASSCKKYIAGNEEYLNSICKIVRVL
jgi:LysM repeat protein